MIRDKIRADLVCFSLSPFTSSLDSQHAAINLHIDDYSSRNRAARASSIPRYPFVTMPIPTHVPRDTLRAEFSWALSEMYRKEVPLYGDLVSLVNEINEGKVQEQGEGMGGWQYAGESQLMGL